MPIVVAHQQDRPRATPTRSGCMQQLSEQGLVPEAWGGDTDHGRDVGAAGPRHRRPARAAPRRRRVEELTANPEGRAKGVVLEANLDVGRGPVATVLVDKGTLKVGDPIVAGAAWGRVRALIDDQGEQVKEAGPVHAGAGARPVRRRRAPATSSVVAPDEKTAETVAEAREHWQRLAELGARRARVSAAAPSSRTSSSRSRRARPPR